MILRPSIGSFGLDNLGWVYIYPCSVCFRQTCGIDAHTREIELRAFCPKHTHTL
ncbi:hypothetical protein HanIR_Chr11g0559071 [Helianthus annuus]|nr:hypothetical protein HanIR_Chr11g0559071 [Helianthus annuus]